MLSLGHLRLSGGAGDFLVHQGAYLIGKLDHCPLVEGVTFSLLPQIPTVGFLYVAGYIGHVGREYLNIAKQAKKPTDKEIIIDVPLALKLSLQGAGWPFKVIQQLRNGTLLEDDKNITVSPR